MTNHAPVGLLEAAALVKTKPSPKAGYGIFREPETEPVWPHFCLRLCLPDKTNPQRVRLYYKNKTFDCMLTPARRELEYPNWFCLQITQAYATMLEAWKREVQDADNWIRSEKRAGRTVPPYVSILIRKSRERRRRIQVNFSMALKYYRVKDLEMTDIFAEVPNPTKTKKRLSTVRTGVINPKNHKRKKVGYQARLSKALSMAQKPQTGANHGPRPKSP